jgi:hypothetical protein
MAKSHLKLVTPATVKRTVTPKRLPNGKLRTREFLTEAEVERLMAAAKRNRWGHRDATIVFVTYRHGLRASELVDLRCGLRWSSQRPPCTSAGSSRGRPAPIRSLGMNCGLCGGFSASRSPSHPSCSLRSGGRLSPPLGLPALWNALAWRRSLASRPTPICSDTLAATP